MISTTIPIQGTFDIAKGRNSLRAHIAAQCWSPTFGARAAAALTALGELILFTSHHNLVIVRMTVVDQGDKVGIHFACNIQSPGENLSAFGEVEDRLDRATDTLELRPLAQSIQVSASICL